MRPLRPGVAGRAPGGLAGSVRRLLAGRAGWAVLGVVVVVALAVGSVHSRPPSEAARISYLDGVIKCPVCADVSIAQSDAAQAANLRATVAELVRSGRSNAEVEAYVVARFGTAELLRPSDPVLWVAPVAAGAIATAAVAAVLVSRRARPRSGPVAAQDESIVSAALAARVRHGAPAEPAAGP